MKNENAREYKKCKKKKKKIPFKRTLAAYG